MPANCDIQLSESNFKTRSSTCCQKIEKWKGSQYYRRSCDMQWL
ncbi:DUF6783 domain-containing protein [uncultured Robinsoniella sp.]